MLDLSPYELVLVLDTQVVLEGKPLDTLPWDELSKAGPILLLCTPTMLSEVDSKKRDGRIGERARQFNRLLEPCIGAGGLSIVREGSPRVELALTVPGKIDWASVEDLDRDVGDDRIVAEALFSRVSDTGSLTMFSYDLRPRSNATRHGLAAIKPPESWIYEPEPSPAQKDITRLKQRVSELEATQPQIECKLSGDFGLPLQLIRVRPLSGEALEKLEAEILAKSRHRGRSTWDMMPDHSYEQRYDKFEKKAKKYGPALPGALERLFNQVAFNLHFRVEGSLGANHLDVQLHADGARLHDKVVVSKVFRPTPPDYRPGAFHQPYLGATIADMMAKVARHEVAFDPKPNRKPDLRLACEDFRHGREYNKPLYAEVDPNGPNPSQIELVITAANLKGSVQDTLSIPFEVEEVDVTDVFDLTANKLSKEFLLQGLFEQLLKENQRDEIEI